MFNPNSISLIRIYPIPRSFHISSLNTLGSFVSELCFGQTRHWRQTNKQTDGWQTAGCSQRLIIRMWMNPTLMEDLWKGWGGWKQSKRCGFQCSSLSLSLSLDSTENWRTAIRGVLHKLPTTNLGNPLVSLCHGRLGHWSNWRRFGNPDSLSSVNVNVDL